ncbi:hypothetical protein [Fluviispira vulneris]|uniref:hypothetical protein n=1 Tax=Fluviispira vulneris TaxID=2763012 RepID=UPI001643FBE8|nr:hypothetical protein [Fluviispira vulneris]
MTELHQLENLSDREEQNIALNLIRSFFSFEKVKYSPRMLFSSTSCFSVKDANGIYIKRKLPFKIVIPDYILENFSLQTRQKKKIIVDFLKIFINELVIQDYIVMMNRDRHLYTFEISRQKHVNFYFNNKKNVKCFFSNYFQNEIEIKENFPKKHINNSQFKLGSCAIYSKNTNKGAMIGSDFYSFLNRISVEVEVRDDELENLEYVLKILNLEKHIMILSNNVKSIYHRKFYKYKFIIEGGKCLYAFSIPNFHSI